jgi:hypothetical protein
MSFRLIQIQRRDPVSKAASIVSPHKPARGRERHRKQAGTGHTRLQHYSMTTASRTFARTATRGGRRISNSSSSAGRVVQIIST